MKKDKTKNGTVYPDANGLSSDTGQGEKQSEEEQKGAGEGVAQAIVSEGSKADKLAAEEEAEPPEGNLPPAAHNLVEPSVPEVDPQAGIDQVPPPDKTDVIFQPQAISSGNPLDAYIHPSLDGSTIALGMIGPPAVLLDDNGLKRVVTGIWFGKCISGLDETGRLVGAQRFENDPEKIFRKGRKPGVVFASIERLMDGKIDRRRIAESTRAYGVELELKQVGLMFDLGYTQRAQIGRLTEKAHRMLLAREIHAKNPSVELIKKRVAEMLKKDSLDDHATGQALLRELQTAGNLLSDDDMKEFVKDKKRLKSLTSKARLQIRASLEGAKANVGVTGDIINDLENILWGIELEEKQQTQAPSQNGSAVTK